MWRIWLSMTIIHNSCVLPPLSEAVAGYTSCWNYKWEEHCCTWFQELPIGMWSATVRTDWWQDGSMARATRALLMFLCLSSSVLSTLVFPNLVSSRCFGCSSHHYKLSWQMVRGDGNCSLKDLVGTKWWKAALLWRSIFPGSFISPTISSMQGIAARTFYV